MIRSSRRPIPETDHRGPAPLAENPLLPAPPAAPTYAAFRDGRLVYPLAPDVVPPAEHQRIHGAFRALVLDPRYSCVGAKSAVRRGTYRMGLYGPMAAASATDDLARDLWTFAHEYPSFGDHFATFVACFSRVGVADEEEFERLLWLRLQQLHALDRQYHRWNPSVSADPSDARFAFSFGGRAFFVVGLHPAASRRARHFDWPALVFNAHDQFDRLRRDGRYASMQRAIRSREMALQGSLNPMLADFGRRSEARQYSGRAVEPDWECPFRVHDTE